MSDFSFICPHCKKESNIVGEAQDETVFYEYDFKTESWEERDKSGGDHVVFYCPLCNEDLPIEMENKLWEKIQ